MQSNYCIHHSISLLHVLTCGNTAVNIAAAEFPLCTWWAMCDSVHYYFSGCYSSLERMQVMTWHLVLLWLMAVVVEGRHRDRCRVDAWWQTSATLNPLEEKQTCPKLLFSRSLLFSCSERSHVAIVAKQNAYVYIFIPRKLCMCVYVCVCID